MLAGTPLGRWDCWPAGRWTHIIMSAVNGVSRATEKIRGFAEREIFAARVSGDAAFKGCLVGHFGRHRFSKKFQNRRAVWNFVKGLRR